MKTWEVLKKKKKKQGRVHKFVTYQTSDCLCYKKDRVYLSSIWNKNYFPALKRIFFRLRPKLLIVPYSRASFSTRAEDGSFTLDQEPTLNQREIDDINVCLESMDHPEPLLFLLLVIQVLCNYYCKCIIWFRGREICMGWNHN